MKKSQLFHLKNRIIYAAVMANIFGNLFIHIMSFLVPLSWPYSEEEAMALSSITIIFTPIAFIGTILAVLLYERPIRCFLNCKYRNIEMPHLLQTKAKQRLINESFFITVLVFFVWLIPATALATAYWALDAESIKIQRGFFNLLNVGLITATVVFFLSERLVQKKLVPHLFPDGGLYMTPKTLRISIRIRLFALLFACNLVPFFFLMHALYFLSSNPNYPAWIFNQLRPVIISYILIFACTGILLTMLVGRNLTTPFKEIITTLREVTDGRFDQKVQVTTNDEIGYTGDVINQMTKGLIEREKIKQSLYLAREVQQNLLPKGNLKINGFDIAGKSIYCDETGGDYYDFISIGDDNNKKIGVVIGDVSGHGISSALLMAAVRSSIRLRASLSSNIADIISDVNRQLVQDVEDSGQFITMFFLAFNTETRQFEWVRAGHDPAIIYDPLSDSFSELGGSGIALGVDAEWIYEGYKTTEISKSQIIFLSTDGIWEARNKKGEMLGKEPILNTIRQNFSSDAIHIIDSIFNTFNNLTEGVKIEDDITSVVIKIQD